MTSETKQATTSRAGVLLGMLLVLLGAGSLLVGLYLARVSRAGSLDTNVLSVEFIALFAASLLLAVLSVVLFNHGRFQDWLQRYPLRVLSVTVLLSAVGYTLVMRVVPLLAPYGAPYVLWLVLLNAGIAAAGLGRYGAALRLGQGLRTAATVALGMALPLLLLEVGLRVYFSEFGTERERISYLYSVDEALQAANRYQGVPYINYGLSASHPEHNRYGYRGAAIEVPKEEPTFRIFALGGSTTYGTGVAPDEAYPAQLQRVLRADYGYAHVEVVNAGVEAYSSFDSLANFSYHVLDHGPDLVIIYHGINDVIARLVDPSLYSGLNPVRGTWSPTTLQNRLSPSVLLRYVGVNLGVMPDMNRFENVLVNGSEIARCGIQETYCTALGMEAAAVLEQNPPIYFERNVRNMIAIARANGVAVMLSTWAYSPDDTPLPNPLMAEHLQEQIALQNDILRALGDELDVPVYDLEAHLPDDVALWQDGMHLTALGTVEQAERYAEFLIDRQLLPPPAE